MRPPDQTENAVRADRKHLERIFERATKNTTRPRARNEEIKQLLARLVILYTEETIMPTAEGGVVPKRRFA